MEMGIGHSERIRDMVVYLIETAHMYWECTYLGFGLLEAPCEYVLHGPLLGIYWLWLCPHSGGRPLEAMLVQRMLFIVLMTAAQISPMSFPSECFSPMFREYLIIILAQQTFILYITFICTLILRITFIRTLASSFLHFFCFSWQAGCPQLFVSSTPPVIQHEILLQTHLVTFHEEDYPNVLHYNAVYSVL